MSAWTIITTDRTIDPVRIVGRVAHTITRHL
jgi:hypothetical protein